MVRGSWFVVAAMLLAPLVTGCSSDDPASAPTVRPTPIAKLDAATVRPARAEFCDRVPAAAVRRALGGDPADHESWGNGDPVGTDAGSGDVGNELGCAWTGAGGTAARAWVFARPVDADLAASIIGAAGRETGCDSDLATVFGNPALLQHCTLTGGVLRDRRAGLFGDTWVTCELSTPGSVPPRQRAARLDSWCAQVVASLTA